MDINPVHNYTQGRNLIKKVLFYFLFNIFDVV